MAARHDCALGLDALRQRVFEGMTVLSGRRTLVAGCALALLSACTANDGGPVRDAHGALDGSVESSGGRKGSDGSARSDGGKASDGSAPADGAGSDGAGSDGASDASEPSNLNEDTPLRRAELAFGRVVEGVDRSCASDSDCALVEVTLPCTYCRILPASTKLGVSVASAAVTELAGACVGEAGGNDGTSPLCGVRGLVARCRAQRCEVEPDACSPGCTLGGDGSCVGRPGLTCERCPPDLARGPCKVPGQRCHYGTCLGAAECGIDSDGFEGARGQQVWLSAFYDCTI